MIGEEGKFDTLVKRLKIDLAVLKKYGGVIPEAIRIGRL